MKDEGWPLTPDFALVPKSGRQFMAEGPRGGSQVSGRGELILSLRLSSFNKDLWMTYIFGFFFYVIWSIYHVVSLELKFSEHLLLISMQQGAASALRIRGSAPWGQAAPRGLGPKSSTRVPWLLHAFPGDCKAFCIDLPFFLPACDHVQINQWSSKCSFMNIVSLFFSSVLGRTSQHQERCFWGWLETP